MNLQSRTLNKSIFYYDAEVLTSISDEIFDMEVASPTNTNTLGRGNAYNLIIGDTEAILKHYHRGGIYGKFINDSYWYTQIKNTRMYKEFALLMDMREKQLPVPTPIAIRITRHRFTYSGDLITQKIKNAFTLAEVLQKRKISTCLWREIARTIKMFHHKSYYHADLNANNIMIDNNNLAYLIDFDKSELKPGSNEMWKKKNLDRLLRSLSKLKNKTPEFNFSTSDWTDFLTGYDQ